LTLTADVSDIDSITTADKALDISNNWHLNQ
jgi:hypothetical protein